MRRNFYLTLVAALLSLGLTAQATTASINGQITDADDLPLIGATVQAIHTPTGTRYGTSAQNDGYYSLNNLRIGGPYEVVISYLGYETETVNGINLKLGEKRNLDVILAEDGETIEVELPIRERD